MSIVTSGLVASFQGCIYLLKGLLASTCQKSLGRLCSPINEFYKVCLDEAASPQSWKRCL